MLRFPLLRGATAVLLCLLLTPAPNLFAQAAGQRAGEVGALRPDATRNAAAAAAAVKDALAWNDLLRTTASGRLRANLVDGSMLSMGSGSELKVVQHDAASQQTELELNYGRLRNRVVQLTKPGAKFEVTLAGFVMYSLDLVYVERRHIAVFVLLFWAAAFSCLRFPNSGRTGRLANALAGVVLAATVGLMLLGAANAWRYIRERPERVHWRVAQELERRGTRPGDRILAIGGGLWSAPLAHLARMQIAAEIPATESAAFWSADRATQAALMERVAQLGIRLVVADCTNCSPPPACARFPNTSVLASADQRDFYVCDIRAFSR